MKPRPYQLEIRDAVSHSFAEGHKRIMVESATGSGKTIIASMIMHEEAGNCLFLADATDLVNQNATKFTEYSGERCGVDMASQHAIPGRDRVVVATTQSIVNRLDKYPEDYFNLIIVDECHRGTLGEQAQSVFKHFSYAKVIGVTATPFRSDRKSLGDFYETIAVQVGLQRLIQEGWLSPIQIKAVPMKVDLTQIAKRGGDYSSEELGDVIEPILELAAEQIRDHAQGRKKIVIFLPLIKTSIRMARILNEMGIKAVHVSGEDRSDMAKFTHGDARVICNAQLLSTGWDYPPVDCVMVLRPTKSLSLYCQFVGRGTRIHPGKENLLLLDPLYMSDDHKLINPARLTARTEAQADAMMAEIQSDVGGEGRDLLGLDQDIEEQRAEALRTRMKQKERKAMRLVDAVEFAVHCDELDTAEFEPEFGWECNSPTEKQIETLEKAGIETAEVTTRGQAGKLLDLLFVRRKQGLATPKQLRLLRRFNHPDPAKATFAEASVFLDTKFNKNGKTASAQVLPTSLMIQLRERGLKPSAYASVKEANKALDEVLPF